MNVVAVIDFAIVFCLFCYGFFVLNCKIESKNPLRKENCHESDRRHYKQKDIVFCG